MDRKKISILLQDMLEQDIPPDTINLWNSMKKDLVLRKQANSKQGATIMRLPKFANRRFKLAAMLSLATVLLAACLTLTPQGRAFTQNVLKYFTRSEQNVKELPTSDAELITPGSEFQPTLPPTDESLSECGTALMPSCSLAQIQAVVDFTVMFPAYMPGTTRFIGAVPIQQGILLKFEGEQGVLLLVEIHSDRPDLMDWMVGKDAQVVSAMVGNNPAEFVQGSWAATGIDEENSIPWDSEMPTRILRWQAGDMQISMVSFPAQSASGPVGLDLPEMLTIAESIHPLTEADDQGLEDTGLTLSQAEEKAGFDYVEPEWLPSGFSLIKTTYDSQHNSICEYYRYGMDDLYPGMVIAQSNWAQPSVEELRSKAYYNGEEVEITITEKWLPVEGAAGNQGRFVETGIQINAFCGGEAASANRALLWQKGGRTFILFGQLDADDGRGFVTVKEMQRIAESLNGVESGQGSVTAFDPERLLSLQDAEEYSGVDIHFPAKMLSNVVFNHISVESSEESETIISMFFSGQPVGDGRSYHVSVSQIPNSEYTLATLQLAGGYSPVEVKGQAGIYQAQCWDSTILSGGVECHQMLTWFESSTQFDIFAYFPAEVPKEMILAIAESME